ncbi:MAG: TIGR04551 family protein, partial [Myxococcota bacterium]
IAGAYYFKPGISYDFIRNSFGQLLGLRADLIYSRAVAPIQTWGNDPDLGVEINATLYYRSEDGPELLDGFYGQLQYGILFPLAGLGSPEGADTQIDLSTAQTVRLILGVQY